MITAVLASAIEPVASGSARGEALRFLLQLKPGQVVSARIETKLPDGSFKVDVAGQQLRMTLPAYAAAGDTLELTFLAREPRPTFALQERLPQAVGAAALSAAGRQVEAMLPQPGEPAVITAASTAAPLLAALSFDGARLSALLEHTLAQSGLFYEAHQADWVAGKRDLAQLRSEPQAGITQTAPKPQARLEQGSTTPVPDSSGAAAPRTDPLTAPQGLSLVQQQLAAFESGRLLLHIEVWPKQWVRWEVEEHAQDLTESPELWRTRLRLDLPQLGELKATLTLSGHTVQIALEAASAICSTLLQNNRASLRGALAAAGVPPAIITIADHEQS